MNNFEAHFIKYLQCRLLCDPHTIAALWTQRYEFKIPFTTTQIVNGTTKHGEYLIETANERLEI